MAEELNDAIIRVRFAPHSLELRRKLRAIAAAPGTQEAAIATLTEEVRIRLCDEPIATGALLEVLVQTFDLLDRPVEAVAAMEQLVALAPDNVEHLLGLAQRCASLGAWSKAAETFERVGTIGTTGQACAALRTAARLYRDNGRPDRAIEACRAILAHRAGDKEAWELLQQLLEQLGRWRELADARGELAKRAPSPIDRASMLRAQARALERAGDAEAAVAVLASAARFMGDDTSGLLDYADVLARSGKGREAAELIAKQVAAARARRASLDEVAALRARQAALLEDACGDRAAAAAVLEELLAEHSTYAPALERLVLHAASAADPLVHARALERYGDAIEELAVRASVHAAAARRFRDGRDRAAAVRCFEQAIVLAPDDAALRAELAELQATVDVELAADEAAAGDPAAAERRLRGILEARPDDPDAVLALAPLVAARGEPAAARQLVQQALAAVTDGVAPAKVARLVLEHARLADAAGDHDEAHRLLHEAHLLDRQSLPITLALAESCVARKLWRQAIRYFAGLADHPDAPRHAASVASGLVHAAQAEVRALRPANAVAHYEAAVRLDPACAAAWHALAADALERGDLERAAACFEREAAATVDPAAHDRLFGALGDLARDHLRDVARAEAFWSRVKEPDATTLRKLLDAQRERGVDVERAGTCMRLAALDPPDARELVEEAARLFAAADDFIRARSAAERLMELHPLDIDAVTCASEIALAACDADAAAAWLERALAGSQRDRSTDPRRAELWRRLGDAERSRHRDAAAKTAYERAFAIAPDSPDGVAARRAHLQLTPPAERAPEALELLVEAEQSPGEVLALARTFAAARRIDEARAVYDLAPLLGIPLSAEDTSFLAETAPRPMAYDESYGAIVDGEVRRAAVDDPHDGPLGEVFELLAEASSALAPDPQTALRQAGIGEATRLPVTSGVAVAALYPQIAKVLDGPATLLVTSDAVVDMQLVLASPPVVVIGSALASIRPGDLGDATVTKLRFQLGRIVELARPRRVFAAGAPDRLELLVDGLWFACSAHAGALEHATIADEAKRVRTLLPVALRRRIAGALGDTPRSALDADAYLAACGRAADRSGLLVCGNPTVAMTEAAGDPAHVLRFAASRKYRRLHHVLSSRVRVTTPPPLPRDVLGRRNNSP